MSEHLVTVVDLRAGPPDDPDELAGRVLVLDHAADLVANAEYYLDLLGGSMVSAVVCVAVGDAASGEKLDGVAIEVPPALRHAVLLWVGDVGGVVWTRTGIPSRTGDGDADNLAVLVAALRVPALFDRLVNSEDLHGLAASPGVRMVSGAMDPAELATARAAAVASLCGDGGDDPALIAAVLSTAAAGGRDGAVLTGPMLAAKTEAVRHIAALRGLAHELAGIRALVGGNRPTTRIGRQVTWAENAAENYRRGVVELLDRMDGHLDVGSPPMDAVTELGVQLPWEADGTAIASTVGSIVDDRIDAGTPLGGLSAHLRRISVLAKPQGCADALARVRDRGEVALPMPSFPVWPLTFALLPVIVVTCAITAFVAGPGSAGWLLGGVLAAGWFSAGWLLMARRPVDEGEWGFAAALPSSVLAYIGPAVIGVAAGALADPLAGLRHELPSLVGQVVFVVAALAVLPLALLAWRSAVRQWRAELADEGLYAAVEDLTATAERTITEHWLPLLRRRSLAAVVSEGADGLAEITDTLADTGNRLFIAPHRGPNAHMPDRPLPQELYSVVRGDLAGACRVALAMAWAAARTGSHTSGSVYARKLDRVLGEYGAEVRKRGLLSATTLSRDPSTRDALLVRVFAESPDAVGALRSTAAGEMTQLCKGGQLAFLSTVTDPVVIRVAPMRLRQVLERDGTHRGITDDPGIVWSEDGDVVGAMRLIPLRTESVRRVHGGVR